MLTLQELTEQAYWFYRVLALNLFDHQPKTGPRYSRLSHVTNRARRRHERRLAELNNDPLGIWLSQEREPKRVHLPMPRNSNEVFEPLDNTVPF